MSEVNWTAILLTSFIFILIAIAFYAGEPRQDKIVKCYDRYGNEIIGQICKESSEFSEMDLKMGMITFAIATLIPIIVGVIFEIKESWGNNLGYLSSYQGYLSSYQ